MKRALITLGGFLLLALVIRFALGTGKQTGGEDAARHFGGGILEVVEAGLKNTARQLSYGLPRPVSGMTTLTKVESSGLTLTFFYVVDPPFGKIDEDTFHEQVTKKITDNLCYEKKVLLDLQNGATYSYNYEDKNGSVIDMLDFNLYNCVESFE